MKVPYMHGMLTKRERISVLRACSSRLKKRKRLGLELMDRAQVFPSGLGFYGLDGRWQEVALDLLAYVSAEDSQLMVLDARTGACVVCSRPGRWWQYKGAKP